MRKFFTVLLLLVLLLLPSRAGAQASISFESVGVGIWPEYDTPTVLVIYKLALPAQLPLPAEVTLRMPPSVTKLAVVAVGPTADSVSDQNVEYKFTPGSDFASVTIKAAAPFIQLEYYDPALNKTGNQRQYTYEWLGDYAVKQFRFELRQPLQSTDLKVDPAVTTAPPDVDGFSFSELKQADVKSGQKLTFNINYQRETDSPSTAFLQVQPSTPLTQTVPGQSTWTTYLPWILGALGLVLLLVAGWVYWSSSSASRAVNKSRKRHVARVESSGPDDGQQAHCAQCGKRAQPGDRFCRVCGARIRRSDA